MDATLTVKYYKDLAQLELLFEEYGKNKLLEMIDYIQTEEWKDNS